MNPLTRWNPFKQLARFESSGDIDALFRAMAPRNGDADMLEMRLDVRDNDKAFDVSLDIPGVSKQDIDVQIDGNQVTVRAQVKRNREGSTGNNVYCERYEGNAWRSFTLPQEVDETKSEARYEDGVLKLTLPKKANGHSRKLAIT